MSRVRGEWGYCRLFLLSVGDSLIVLQENKSVFLHSCSKTARTVHLISWTFLKETSGGHSTGVQNSDSADSPTSAVRLPPMGGATSGTLLNVSGHSFCHL